MFEEDTTTTETHDAATSVLHRFDQLPIIKAEQRQLQTVFAQRKHSQSLNSFAEREAMKQPLTSSDVDNYLLLTLKNSTYSPPGKDYRKRLATLRLYREADNLDSFSIGLATTLGTEERQRSYLTALDAYKNNDSGPLGSFLSANDDIRHYLDTHLAKLEGVNLFWERRNLLQLSTTMHNLACLRAPENDVTSYLESAFVPDNHKQQFLQNFTDLSSALTTDGQAAGALQKKARNANISDFYLFLSDCNATTAFLTSHHDTLLEVDNQFKAALRTRYVLDTFHSIVTSYNSLETGREALVNFADLLPSLTTEPLPETYTAAYTEAYTAAIAIFPENDIPLATLLLHSPEITTILYNERNILLSIAASDTNTPVMPPVPFNSEEETSPMVVLETFLSTRDTDANNLARLLCAMTSEPETVRNWARTLSYDTENEIHPSRVIEGLIALLANLTDNEKADYRSGITRLTKTGIADDSWEYMDTLFNRYPILSTTFAVNTPLLAEYAQSFNLFESMQATLPYTEIGNATHNGRQQSHLLQHSNDMG